ncbi:MAG: FHA domain-containing protein [Chthoniobacteraceae bacterium]
MSHQLVFSSEKGKPRSYPVAGERLSIGRHPKNAIVLEDELVSIFHAEVFVENGKTLLCDLKSSNGTKVNGKRVTEAALKVGDEIRFGPIICHFRSLKISAKAPEKKFAGGNKSKAAGVAAVAMKIPAPPEREPEPEPPLPFFPRVLLRISESRYFALSLVIHAVIVILAGSLVLYKAAIEPPDFVASGGDGLIATDDLSPPPETPADTVPTEKSVQQAPSLDAPTVSMITTTAVNSSFKTLIPQVQVKLASAASLTRNLGTSRAFAAGLPGTLGGRMGAGRARAMALNGMKPKSEEAVLRGLTWLALHQNEDGSWGENNKGAMTGFGVLCFLGHGELQDSPLYGATVGKALTWIFENGTKNEGHLHMAPAFTSQGVYEHAICAYALGEYYTMTKDRRVVKLLTQAVAHIIEGQGPGGGWMYTYDKSGDDLSVSGWQIQALKAAHLGQLQISGVDQSLTKAVAYIERVRGPNGGYGYRSASDDYSLTGVGILCQLFWKGERGDLRKGMTWLLDQTEKSRPVKYKERSADLYAWYYHTQACLMFGGEAWTKWNGWFQDEICDVQNPDGSWPIPGGDAIGPQNGDTLTGAVYRTSLCVLMLEVFYRYMPTTRG